VSSELQNNTAIFHSNSRAALSMKTAASIFKSIIIYSVSGHDTSSTILEAGAEKGDAPGAQSL